MSGTMFQWKQQSIDITVEEFRSNIRSHSATTVDGRTNTEGSSNENSDLIFECFSGFVWEKRQEFN